MKRTYSVTIEERSNRPFVLGPEHIEAALNLWDQRRWDNAGGNGPMPAAFRVEITECR